MRKNGKILVEVVISPFCTLFPLFNSTLYVRYILCDRKETLMQNVFINYRRFLFVLCAQIVYIGNGECPTSNRQTVILVRWRRRATDKSRPTCERPRLTCAPCMWPRPATRAIYSGPTNKRSCCSFTWS